jgi:CBS domain-containing protein
VELLLDGHQQDFPVLGASERDPPVGILARSDLMKALANGRLDTKVGDVARRNCGVANPGEMLEDVFQKMQESGCPAVPVVEPGRGVVGMVTLENVGEFAMVQTALGRGERFEP